MVEKKKKVNIKSTDCDKPLSVNAVKSSHNWLIQWIFKNPAYKFQTSYTASMAQKLLTGKYKEHTKWCDLRWPL